MPGGFGYVSAASHCSRFHTPPPEPDHASGTHHASQSIRYLRHTRDRSRVEADLAVARSASSIATPGQQRFAPRRGARDRPAWARARCALLKQYRQLSYEELAFHLEESASFRAFARLPMGWTPKKAVLQKTISAITAASWEAINQAVVCNARQTRLEPATMVRIDSTVTEAVIHEPSDSSLLCDAVRVMTRLLEQAGALAGRAAISWRDHRRLAKKRAHAIQHSRGKERKAKLYRELLAATRATKQAL